MLKKSVFLIVLALFVCAAGYGIYTDRISYSDLMDRFSRTKEDSNPQSSAYKELASKARRNNALDFIAATPEFSEFANILKSAELDDILGGDGPITVFAPSNKAFETLPKPLKDILMNGSNDTLLADILSYHIIPGAILVQNIGSQPVNVAALKSRPVRLSQNDGRISLNGIEAVYTDLLVKNGVVHSVDSLSIGAQAAPPPALSSPVSSEPPAAK